MTTINATLSIDSILLAFFGALVGIVVAATAASIVQARQRLRVLGEEIQDDLTAGSSEETLRRMVRADEQRLRFEENWQRRLGLVTGAYTVLLVLTGLTVGLITTSSGLVYLVAGTSLSLLSMLFLFELGRRRRFTLERDPLLEPWLREETHRVASTLGPVTESAAESWLRENGWRVDRQSRGIDFVASKGNEQMLVEAKEGRLRKADIDRFIGQVTRRRLSQQDPSIRYALVLGPETSHLGDADIDDLKALGVELYRTSSEGEVKAIWLEAEK